MMIFGETGNIEQRDIRKAKDRGRGGNRRGCRFVPAMLLFIFLSGGCNKGFFTSIELPEESSGSGMGLQAEAVYLSDPDEISDLFNAFLPARGVLPILVTVRNNDTVTLRLHSRNGLPLRDEFSGFLLAAGVDTIEPIHPLDVVRIIRGNGQVRAYREVDAVDVVTGTLFPPLGAWYAWEEYRSRREFKPILKASLLPSRYGGAFEPLTLSPGEEASGYLYFAVDSEYIPYDSVLAVVESRKVDLLGKKKSKTIATYRLKEDWNRELILSCLPSPVPEGDEGAGAFVCNDSLPSSQICFPSTGRDRSSGKQEEESDGIFALIPGKKGRSLVFGRPDQGGSAIVSSGFSVIKEFSSDGVDISGAAVLDGLAVCAVNFTRRSKVMVIDLARGGARLMNTADFDRKIEKVFFLRGEDGSAPEVFAFISDNSCHRVPLGRGEKDRYMKFGNDIKDIALDGRGRLFAFSGDELRIWERGGRRLFEPVSNNMPGRFDVEIVGEFGERLVMLARGRKGAGDTLRVFDTDLIEEVSAIAVPAGVVLTGATDEGLLVHLEEGTLLEFGIDSDGELFIRDSVYFPGRFTAMTATGGVVTLLRDDGDILTGMMEGGPPTALRGGIVVSVDRSPPRPR
ncbi:MAG: hypothetical protein KOO63_11745 [Bacteroidales bacterium]|nr:hypothetical protein [Candidatus Latescibacterota bacterium]